MGECMRYLLFEAHLKSLKRDESSLLKILRLEEVFSFDAGTLNAIYLGDLLETKVL